MYGSVKTNAQLSPTLKYIYVCIFVRTTKKGLAYESNPFKPASSSFVSSIVLADINATVLQPPIYRRGPPPSGMPMIPMLLPNAKIGYVFQQPGTQPYNSPPPQQRSGRSCGSGEEYRSGGRRSSDKGHDGCSYSQIHIYLWLCMAGSRICSYSQSLFRCNLA
ncbi:Heterogeneous nuclear ribonucleoprotein Q [Camellia lanceoleosa]|uniref:Heterogeneous nuclear ribonucleoprotein Q n=1 Tax=Camellia lanceoleosa TaxID=1840588 RepID=A0ACC0FYU8_9ERIC|nr:Heterogeneous nuclear ribonucleoprotein Q [Camellia lanceoleosa]